MENKTPTNNENEKLLEALSGIKIISHEYVSQLETELADKDRQLAEARAEIEALKRNNTALNEEIKMQRTYVAGRDNTIERKDKLVEQMREALEIALDCVKEIHGEESRDYTEIKAALAAERGKR